MLIKKIANSILFCTVLSTEMSCSHHLPDFSSTLSTRLPTNEQTESLGEYTLGCLKGAQTFNGNEVGLVLSRVKRGRYWGHPDLINLIREVGIELYNKNKKMIVGDLSLSRGGPMILGHNSHQNGLDVDIWFKALKADEFISFNEVETLEMNPIQTLGEDQLMIIHLFAKNEKVERIFINPKLKKNLCDDMTDKKLGFNEQRKLRAWWGHDDHIHVRLKCPKNNLNCISQKAIPEGNGCGEDLNWWFSEEANSKNTDPSWEELKKLYLEKVDKLPYHCEIYKKLD